MDRSQFIHASRFPGGKDKVPKNARRLRDLLPGDPEDGDQDPLIELTRHRVLRTERHGGAEVVAEAETVNQTMNGEVTVHTIWKDPKVNAKVSSKEFDRK